jgi:hypothetical protein
LNGCVPSLYRQIGAALGLGGERARQLHTEALLWLNHRSFLCLAQPAGTSRPDGLPRSGLWRRAGCVGEGGGDG